MKTTFKSLMIKKIAFISLIGVLSQTPAHADVSTGVVTAIGGCALQWGQGNTNSEVLFKVNGLWFRVQQRTYAYQGSTDAAGQGGAIAPFEKVIMLSYLLSRPLTVQYTPTTSQNTHCGRQIAGYAYFDAGNGVFLE